jgi:hypothetical protein
MSPNHVTSAAGSLALAGCLLGLVACTLEGTTDVPGDTRRFDPIAALPAVKTFAGGGAELVSIDALYVREDGTQDLEASYAGNNDSTTYHLVRANSEKVDTTAPVGARKPKLPYETVVVAISKPHGVSQSVNGGPPQSKTHKGMEVRPQGPVADKKVVQAPCSFAKLWGVAKANGAPAGAVAKIQYDATGYTFGIDGAGVTLRFDTACQLVK